MAGDGSVGLVLSGGGAKGAFQAGVWKAMCERGIADRVRVISGTSVGAINAVTFSLVRDPIQVQSLWFDHVEDVVCTNYGLKFLGGLVPSIWDAVHGKPFPFCGIFSRPGLVDLLQKVISRPISETGIDVYATALSCNGSVLQTFDADGYALKRFHLNDEHSPERIQQMVLASAAIPWGFDPLDIDGVRYVDGAYESGGGDNVPIAPIVDNFPDINTIYVVRCNSRRVDGSPNLNVPGKRIIEIRPRINLPGILDDLNLLDDSTFTSWSGDLSFKAEYVQKYFAAGYADGLVALRPQIMDAKLEW